MEDFEKFKIKPQIGDILMTRITAGIIGDTAVIEKDEELGYYVSLALIRKKAEINSYFLNYYINSPQFKHELHKKIIHVAFPQKINLGDIGSCYIKIPILTEQEKIASFLTSIDNLISTQESNISILETYNRGLISKIFKQEIRFKDDNGNEFPDWEETTLGNIITPNIIETSKPTKDYIRLGIRSHCKGTFHEKVKIENILEADKMYLVPKDNLIVNITFAWEQAIAITTKEDEGKYVSGRFPTYAFNNNQLPAFYKFVISNKKLKYDMGVASPGGAGRNRVLNRELFLKIKITIPCLKEQEKIANFLTSLDNVLLEEKNYLEYLKTIKKGLLQQMFV